MVDRLAKDGGTSAARFIAMIVAEKVYAFERITSRKRLVRRMRPIGSRCGSSGAGRQFGGWNATACPDPRGSARRGRSAGFEGFRPASPKASQTGTGQSGSQSAQDEGQVI